MLEFVETHHEPHKMDLLSSARRQWTDEEIGAISLHLGIYGKGKKITNKGSVERFVRRNAHLPICKEILDTPSKWTLIKFKAVYIGKIG